jgi:hypothetical protein
MTRSFATLFALTTVVIVHASPAHAYRNKDRFSDPVDDGGGGQKYFTGSRAEGYTCQVCHTAGQPVSLQIQGLPSDGYIPGARYRITLDWPDDLPSVAVNLEMTDLTDRAFGELTAADPATLSPSDLCTGTDHPDASQVVVASETRRVLLIGECGQAQSTFDWQAPATQRQGFITGSLLVSNRNGKVTGDRVVDFSRSFGAASDPNPKVDAYAGECAVMRAGQRGPSAGAVWAGVAVALAVRGRRARRRRAGRDTTKSRQCAE